MIPTQREYLSPLYTAMNLAKGVTQRVQKGLVKKNLLLIIWSTAEPVAK
jgi:hypothetical protein